MLRVLLIAALLFTALLAAIWVFQRRLIYFPSPGAPILGNQVETVDEVRFVTEDGLDLTAWFLPASHPGSGSIIVFNGNAGSRADRLPLGEALAHAGYSVLLVDYRGYGGNPGTPSEEGLALDARGALAYMQDRPDIDRNRIVYFGESLGAGVAVSLAAHRQPAALVLRSPFTSLREVASVHYPFIPAGLLLRDHYPNSQIIGDIESPLLVIAGSNDRIVPAELSRRLYEEANQPKRLVVVEDAGHNDFALLAGNEMVSEIVSFLGEELANG